MRQDSKPLTFRQKWMVKLNRNPDAGWCWVGILGVIRLVIQWNDDPFRFIEPGLNGHRVYAFRISWIPLRVTEGDIIPTKNLVHRKAA